MKNLIKFVAQEIAEDSGFLLINILVKGSNKSPRFEIFIDNQLGINAEDCAKFSREFKNRLESTEMGELDYELVVSSPGTDEPIKYIEQYPKHVGREFKISYEDNDLVKSIEAKLVQVLNNVLVFEYKNEKLNIDFNKIKKAKVKISF